MIYLFDDKKPRQVSDYGWNEERLEKYSDILIPVYTYDEMKESQKRQAIFSTGNIILFHESFFDNTINSHVKDSVEIRTGLSKFAAEKNGWVVFFSGSKSSRTLDERVAHIPVSVLYKNLEDFIEKFNENKIDLRYLLYGGKNPEIEEELLIRLEKVNKQFDESPIITDQKNLLVLTGNRINIPVILKGAIEKTFTFEKKYDKEIADTYLNDKVIEWFSTDEVDNIFIPLCFGSSLSDYNGLQFACHIRCTNTINRLKPIFIYSFVDYSFLLENEYFNLLKTKNIFLIDYTRIAFKDALIKEYEPLKIQELSKEMWKLKLDAPKNYEDSHSIANEWAIYRWALSIEANDDQIEKVTQKINHQLYFKYLQAAYPKSETQLFTKNQLKIEYSGYPKILYIDDEADKGWYEIFCKILYDFNGLSFEHLDEEFNSKTQEEIIKTCIDKITKDDIDLVILDFRLHPNDFSTKNIGEVTGLKLLKEIKKLNPGIQVIMFSATNKVWNLQVLHDAGADGFIMKESPENSIDTDFTVKVINNFISEIEKCIKKTFLKDFYDNLEKLKKELIPRKNYKKSVAPLPKEFVDEVLKWVELSYNLLCKEISITNLTASFLFMFSVLENLSNRIINVETPFEIPHNLGKFKFEFRIDKRRLKRFIEDENNLGYYRRTKTVLESKRNIPWIYKILNTLDFITDEKLSEQDINKLVKKRNDLIHANSTTGEKFDINIDLLISLNTVIYNGLINVK